MEPRHPDLSSSFAEAPLVWAQVDQVEDKVEGKVCHLQSIGDENSAYEWLPISWSASIEVEVDQLRRRDKNKRHSNDTD